MSKYRVTPRNRAVNHCQRRPLQTLILVLTPFEQILEFRHFGFASIIPITVASSSYNTYSLPQPPLSTLSFMEKKASSGFLLGKSIKTTLFKLCHGKSPIIIKSVFRLGINRCSGEPYASTTRSCYISKAGKELAFGSMLVNCLAGSCRRLGQGCQTRQPR